MRWEPRVSASFNPSFLFAMQIKKPSPTIGAKTASSRYHPNYSPSRGHLSHPVTGMNRPAPRRLLQSGCFAAWTRGLHHLPSRFSRFRKIGFVIAFSLFTEIIISVLLDLSTGSSGKYVCFFSFQSTSFTKSVPFRPAKNLCIFSSFFRLHGAILTISKKPR